MLCWSVRVCSYTLQVWECRPSNWTSAHAPWVAITPPHYVSLEHLQPDTPCPRVVYISPSSEFMKLFRLTLWMLNTHLVCGVNWTGSRDFRLHWPSRIKPAWYCPGGLLARSSHRLYWTSNQKIPGSILTTAGLLLLSLWASARNSLAKLQGSNYSIAG